MRGNKVVAPGPETAGHKVGWKRKRWTLTVWINSDGDIGVNSHTGQDPIATKDWVRRQCGLKAWEPKKRKTKPMPPVAERSQFLTEGLRIARDRKRITFEQFALIVNDVKNVCAEATLRARAGFYAREFGFSPADMEAALHQEWRAYTASERAAVFQITYDEYRRLRLRRSGCIELDPAERRRLTKQRYNAKRRADSAAKRVSTSAERRAPLCPSEKVGTVRVPSSLKVVGKHRGSSKVRQVTPSWEIIPEGREWCEGNGSQERATRWGEGGGLSGHQGHRTGHRMALAEREVGSGSVRYGAATVRAHPVQSRIGTDNGRTHAFDAVWEIVPTMAAIKRTRQTPARMEFCEEVPMFSNNGLRPDFGLSEMQERHRKIEADLTDQGIKFYPPTTAGERARTLWRHIKGRLLRGAAVEITVTALKLDWHREELRRARAILIDMELIKPRTDGRYMLGRLGPFSRIDELIRDQYLDLKLMEGVVVALSAITSIASKSKTHERPRPSSASQRSAAGNKGAATCGNASR